MDQPYVALSLTHFTSCNCKKGKCGNWRCKCVSVGFFCSDWCTYVDCENHDRESNDEDTSTSEIEFSDSDSDWIRNYNLSVLPEIVT